MCFAHIHNTCIHTSIIVTYYIYTHTSISVSIYMLYKLYTVTQYIGRACLWVLMYSYISMPLCISRFTEHISACMCMNSQAYTIKDTPTHFPNCHLVIFGLAHYYFPTCMASSINIPFLPCLLICFSPDKHDPVTMTCPRPVFLCQPKEL